MTIDAGAAKFVRTIRQKTDADGKSLPVWSWRLQRSGVTVAFGERSSEQGATSAAQAAERNYGAGLEAAGS